MIQAEANAVWLPVNIRKPRTKKVIQVVFEIHLKLLLLFKSKLNKHALFII